MTPNCPKCGHFWMRDYPFPVRHCPACGEPKPPRVACLCPTYHRPACLRNALACFLQQTYPNAEMLILDDGQQYSEQSGNRWRLVASPERFASLPAKYNAMVRMTDAEIIVVWEDDDCWLPRYIVDHVAALEHADFSVPMTLWSNYQRERKSVYLDRRIGPHACYAFRREAFDRIGGYPETRAVNFDQLFLYAMRDSGARIVDPFASVSPSFIYRVGNVYYHGGVLHGDFWEQCRGRGDATWQGRLCPEMDDETTRLLSELT